MDRLSGIAEPRARAAAIGPYSGATRSRPSAKLSIAGWVARRGFYESASHAVRSLDDDLPPDQCQARFVDAIPALGAESAVFINAVTDSSDPAHVRLMLGCELQWGPAYLALGGLLSDPWLRHAEFHGEPRVMDTESETIAAAPSLQRPLLQLAAQHGMRSVLLVPAHSPSLEHRFSLLVLASSRSGHWQDPARPTIEIFATALATRLHGWWQHRWRAEVLGATRLTNDELWLLRAAHAGLSSKHIANALNVSDTSIDSRFQRLSLKLKVTKRSEAARLAVECGLIDDLREPTLFS